MFHPLSLFVGLRYVRSRRRGFFVSFISWVSMLGICLGVTALIVIVSVMNGLEGEVRGRLLSLASHATISAAPAQLRKWQEIADKIKAAPGVVGVAPYIETPALLGRNAQLMPVQLRGVLPQEENNVSEIGRFMKEGSMRELTVGSQNIVLGRGLAWQLDVHVGDDITVLVPQSGSGQDSVLDINPRMQTFTVSGIFEVGLQEHDNALALIHMDDAANLLGTGGAPTGLRLKFADIFAAPKGVAQIAKSLGSAFTPSDWTIENASYFRAVRIERTMMTIILMLVVNEKRNDIAILRTLGVKPQSVLAIFLTQGLVIGWLGALLGVGLGLTVAFNVGPISAFLESVFGIQIFDPNVVYVTQVVSEVHGLQVFTVASIAMLLTLLATIYPSLRAARTEPADALRYE